MTVNPDFLNQMEPFSNLKDSPNCFRQSCPLKNSRKERLAKEANDESCKGMKGGRNMDKAQKNGSRMELPQNV